jgi:hypothetical protein
MYESGHSRPRKVGHLFVGEVHHENHLEGDLFGGFTLAI